MATANLTALEEYLSTTYRPDREYVDGVIVKRGPDESDTHWSDGDLGTHSHAKLQLAIGMWFANRSREWGIQALPELRLRVSETRYRVPDVAVLREDQPFEEIPTHPPLLIVEILSPSDRLMSFEERINDYLDFGIEHIWLINPKGPVAWAAKRDQLFKAGNRLEVPGTPIYLDLSELGL